MSRTPKAMATETPQTPGNVLSVLVTEESTPHMASLVEAGIRSVFSFFPLLGVSLFVLTLSLHAGVHMLCKHCTAKLHPRF